MNVSRLVCTGHRLIVISQYHNCCKYYPGHLWAVIEIANVLSDTDCGAIAETLCSAAIWSDGGATARGAALAAKNNLQADRDTAPVRGAIAKISKALLEHDVFNAFAQPHSLVRLMINRFEQGMAYDDHVDAPYIDGRRTDLAFTLFLSDPQSYDGGALIINACGTQDSVKLARGSLVLYPARYIHRVEPVTRGQRLACVGWVESRITSPTMRESLFELERVIADLGADLGASLGARAHADLRLRLMNIRNNLLRESGR